MRAMLYFFGIGSILEIIFFSYLEILDMPHPRSSCVPICYGHMSL